MAETIDEICTCSDNNNFAPENNTFKRVVINLLCNLLTEAQSTVLNVTTETSTYLATATDQVILCDGTFTVDLPTAVGIEGQAYYIKNIGVGVITVDADGIETIDGSTTQPLTAGESIKIVSDNTEWWII